MASLAVTIAGGASHDVQTFTLTIELGSGRRGKRCNGELWIEGPGVAPLTGNVIIISIDGADSFQGVLVQVKDELINPETHKITFDAMDYSLQLDSHLVTTTRDEELLSVRVDELLAEYAVAFSRGGVAVDELVPEQAIDHRTLSSIFDELAELTGQYFELRFDRTANFLTVGDPAPIGAISIDNINIGDLVILEDWSDLHNVLIIKDFTMRSPYSITDTFTVDGLQSFFGLTYPPWTTEETVVQVKYGDDPWNTRTSVLDPLGAQSEYEMYRPGPGDPDIEAPAHKAARLADLATEKVEIENGYAGEAYICIWNIGVRFPLSDLPADGSIVRVIYPFERREQVLESRNLSSIAVMAAREGTDGIHEKVISLPALHAISLQSATDYTEMLLARGAWPSITGSFYTYIGGWEPGQKSTLSGEDTWVSKVVKTIVAIAADGGTWKVHHEVHCTNQPQSVPIPLDEFLHRLIDQTQRIRPPGNPPVGPVTTSTTTTTLAYTTSTTTTRLPRPILMTKYTTFA